jgi:hypothetical protein
MAEGRHPQQEPVHDVLAAEAFAMPGPDPALRRTPVMLPDDPSGIADPHDVLAAEEFAMPAAVENIRRSVADAPGWAKKLAAVAAAFIALLGLRRRRR